MLVLACMALACKCRRGRAAWVAHQQISSCGTVEGRASPLDI